MNISLSKNSWHFKLLEYSFSSKRMWEDHPFKDPGIIIYLLMVMLSIVSLPISMIGWSGSRIAKDFKILNLWSRIKKRDLDDVLKFVDYMPNSIKGMLTILYVMIGVIVLGLVIFIVTFLSAELLILLVGFIAISMPFYLADVIIKGNFFKKINKKIEWTD